MRLMQRLRRSVTAPMEFPWPMFASVLVTILTLCIVHRMTRDDHITTINWALSASIPWLIAIAFTVRAGGYSRGHEAILSVGIMAAAIAIMLLAPSPTYPAIFLNLAGLAYLAVAPYAQRRTAALNAPCHYQLSLVTSFIFTGLSVVIFCLGINAILVSLRYLFEVHWPNRLYFDVWIVGSGILGMAWFTGSIARAHLVSDNTAYPRWAMFIVTYLLVPLLAAYLLILYAYAGKVLFLTEIPKGRLGMMISMFGMVGVFTHYLARPLSVEGKSILAKVDRYFYPALIAPLLLLAYAINERVAAYGITEDRYVLILIAVWFAFLCGAHLMRRLNMMLWTPLSAAVLLFLASFGPLSATSVSTRSQLHELRTLLTEAGVLVDGKIQPTPVEPRDVPIKLRNRISNVVQYFTHSEKTAALEPLMLARTSNQNRWEMPRAIMQQWGLPPANQHYKSDNSFRFNYHNNERKRLLDVAGYDVVLPSLGYYLGSAQEPTVFKDDADQPRLTVHADRTSLSITDAKDRTVRFDMAGIGAQLAKQVGNAPLTDETRKLMVHTQESQGLRVRLELTNLNVILRTETFEVQNFSGILSVGF